jgi:protein O-mannosyl-transferase
MPEQTTKPKVGQRVRDRKSTAHSLPTGYWLLGLALLLAVVSYWPTLRYGFVFDDIQQIVENPAIKSWSSVPQYFTAHVGAGMFPGVRGSFYRPLFLIWLRLNYILFKVSPWGWHLTSLLAHLGAVWMFFALVRQRVKDGIVAGWAALLFAVHPIHIEAVAWISAVPEILFALAGMGAIYAYVRFRQEKRPSLLGLSVFLYAVALLAKETAIVIWPAIFISEFGISEFGLDRSHDRQGDARGRFAKAKAQLPFAAVTAAYFALRSFALHGMRGEVTHTFREVVCSAPSITWFYLQKLVLPIRLSQIYFYPEHWSFASLQFFLPLIALCAVAVFIFLWVWKSRSAAFPALLLALSLIPPLLGVSVFPPHDLAHNRYLYLPSAGACMLLALALQKAIDSGSLTVNFKGHRMGTAIVAVLSLVFVVGIWTQEGPYRDNVALFTHSVEIAPESAMAWGLLGEEYMTSGKYNEGIAAFHTAQTLHPDVLLNNYRLGAAYYLVQNMPLAETYFQRALLSYHDPDVVTYDYVLYRLGLSQYAQDKMPEAEATLRRATELEPKGFGYHLALGATLKYEGHVDEAKKQLELELQLGPDQEASTLLQTVNSELSARH